MANDPKKTSVDSRNWRVPKWFPELGDVVLTKMRALHAELIFFNGRMNLISPRTEATADQIHFADCILGSRIILRTTASKTIYDMGSGNGLPGLILALMDATRQVHLIDADARKIEFIKHCIARLELKNCSAIHARVEDLGDGVLDCGVTRAMASISKTLMFARKAASSGAEFYHMKGQAWSREIAEIPSQVLAFWDISHVDDYSLPESEIKMSIVATKRSKKV